LLLILPKFRINLLNNTFNVLFNKKTWVGYYLQNTDSNNLPKIKKGVLSPIDLLKDNNISDIYIKNSNMVYAKDYNIWNDFKILFKGFKNIDRR